MNTEPTPAGKGRSRLYLLVVMGLFAAPVVLAWLVFFVFPDWRPAGTVNHGELVAPVRPLPAFRLHDAGGAPVDETLLRGKWTLLLLQQGDCDDACMHRLYDVRQIRLAQGKNIDRLQRVMLWASAGAGGDEIAGTFPGQTLIPLDPAADAGLIATFAVDAADPLTAQRLYLVDPAGNLMMRYEPDADPRGTIKDLERLLKYSGLG